MNRWDGASFLAHLQHLAHPRYEANGKSGLNPRFSIFYARIHPSLKFSPRLNLLKASFTHTLLKLVAKLTDITNRCSPRRGGTYFQWLYSEKMDTNRLQAQLQAFDTWKVGLIKAIEDYQSWLAKHQLGSPAVELRLYEAIETLRSDKLTIAFVAEFSRGKTELINAIFFADYKRRLLPSEIGRTTMCPTELFFDNASPDPYVRLLPIETRLNDVSIAELKKEPAHWVTLPLDIQSADQMAATFREVAKVKRVTIEEAQRLGLYNEEALVPVAKKGAPPTHVDVPMWRHAMISFPHPLLQQGLVILDTPGLNALGTEPELTISMIPNAHAVIFVLAADTGVTRSDLDIWQYHITKFRQGNQNGLVATLNKIDALWDEMKTKADIDASITAQCKETARLLDIDVRNVFPVSAQKALVAKSKQDPELLAQSRILALEALLADEIVPSKQRIVSDSIARQIGALLSESRQLVANRLASSQHQLSDLSSLASRNKDVLQQLTEKTRERQAAYQNSVKYFQSSRRSLAQQAKTMVDELSVASFDQMVTRMRKTMTDSWTTAGLKTGMKALFDSARDTMQVVTRHAEQTRALIDSIYRKFREDNDMPEIKFPELTLLGYLAELETLYQHEEEFRHSTVTTMTEQSLVVKKFFISLVSHVREVFVKASQETDRWLGNVMNPLVQQIEENKLLLEKRLETLCKINESSESLGEKRLELESYIHACHTQLGVLDNIAKALTPPSQDPPPVGDSLALP